MLKALVENSSYSCLTKNRMTKLLHHDVPWTIITLSMSFWSLRSFSQYQVTRDSGGLPLSHRTTVTFITSVLFPFAPDRQRQCWKHQWKTNTYAVTRNPPAKQAGRKHCSTHCWQGSHIQSVKMYMMKPRLLQYKFQRATPLLTLPKRLPRHV